MKKFCLFILSIAMIFSLSSFTTVSNEGDYTLAKGVRIKGYSGCLIVYEKDGKYGFSYSNLNGYVPEWLDFSGVKTYDWAESGYLVWVSKDGKWGIYNAAISRMETDFIYSDSKNNPKEISAKDGYSTYEIETRIGNKRKKITIKTRK